MWRHRNWALTSLMSDSTLCTTIIYLVNRKSVKLCNKNMTFFLTMLVVFNFICSLESHRPRTVTKDLTIGLNYEKSWLFKLWCCSRRTHASLIILMKIAINHTEYMYILFCIRNPSSLNIGLYMFNLSSNNNCTLSLWRLGVSTKTLMVVCISFIINNHSKLLKKNAHNLWFHIDFIYWFLFKQYNFWLFSGEIASNLISYQQNMHQ